MEQGEIVFTLVFRYSAGGCTPLSLSIRAQLAHNLTIPVHLSQLQSECEYICTWEHLYLVFVLGYICTWVHSYVQSYDLYVGTIVLGCIRTWVQLYSGAFVRGYSCTRVHSYVGTVVLGCIRTWVQLYSGAFVLGYMRTWVRAWELSYLGIFVRACNRTWVHSYVRAIVRGYICTWVQLYLYVYLHAQLHRPNLIPSALKY